jgi:hypothetical protein
MLLDQLNELFEICDSSSFSTLVGGGYKVIDRTFVILEERVDMGLVEYFGTLCLWEDEIEEKGEADPRVKRYPAERKHGQWEIRDRPRGSTEERAYQNKINPNQDSTSKAEASTTQYISHGLKRAGSEVLRAL